MLSSLASNKQLGVGLSCSARHIDGLGVGEGSGCYWVQHYREYYMPFLNYFPPFN